VTFAERLSVSKFSCRTYKLRCRYQFLLFATIAAATFLSAAPSASAQQSKPEEYQVKAVYLFNFGRFIEWPDAAIKGQTFTICVLGEDPFGRVLDTTLAGEAINNRKLVARRIGSVRDATNCQILFISSSEASRVAEIVTAMNKTGTLTVSDTPGFANKGGMIQFVLVENKVRFDVNLTAAEKEGLTISSQLLKVAANVKKEEPPADVNPVGVNQ
jgi:YfiR/HmsC-like